MAAELLHFAGGWGAREADLPPPSAREAVEKLLAYDDAWWSRFEAACLAGVLTLRADVCAFRSELRERGHEFETHAEQFEEVFRALMEIAEEYFPDSPAAVRPRLRERVRENVQVRADGFALILGEVPARRAVEVVVAYEDRYFEPLVDAIERGHRDLYELAGRVRAALALAGRRYGEEEVEDALWMIVREFFPGSPPARPDDARIEGLWACAQEYVSEHDPDGALGEKERGEHEVRALNAIKLHNLPGLRAALREMCRAARDAARAEGSSEAS